MDIDVRELIRKTSKSDIADQLEREWDDFAKDFGIKDKLHISQKQYIVNPERFLTEKGEDAIYRRTGHMLNYSNFQNKLKAYWLDQTDKQKGDDLALELVRMNMYNFNSWSKNVIYEFELVGCNGRF